MSLSLQGITIVAVDRPGAGHSSFNPGGTFASFAGDVKVLLDHLGLARVVVMAVSGGFQAGDVHVGMLEGRACNASLG